jgi:hypothetical protein
MLIYKIRRTSQLNSKSRITGDLFGYEFDSVTPDVPCDLVLGSYSTLLYEMVAMGIPVCIAGR